MQPRSKVIETSRLDDGSTVHQVLINEKYVGNNVWNHNSFKQKLTRVENPAVITDPKFCAGL